MKLLTFSLGAVAASAAFALVAAAQTHTGAAAGTIVPRFEHAISNIPGKSMVAVEVTYPPGGSSGPHHHAGSAFIMAYVVSGSIVSQVEGEPERTFHAGETWYEDPGAHHVVSRNASSSEPAKLLAVFVVDSSDKKLTVPDTQAH